MKKPYLTLCKVKKPNETITPEMSICRVFKYLRLLKCMTQEDISKRQTPDGKSMSQSFISKIEAMKTIPDFETLFIFCALTDTNPQDFLDYVSKTLYMTNGEAAEYIGKAVMKKIIENEE